eukprot:scaffold134043_cov17-Tisochrysis_lutea.AAC.1
MCFAADEDFLFLLAWSHDLAVSLPKRKSHTPPQILKDCADHHQLCAVRKGLELPSFGQSHTHWHNDSANTQPGLCPKRKARGSRELQGVT